MRVKPGPVEITEYKERKKAATYKKHTKGQMTGDILEDNNVNE